MVNGTNEKIPPEIELALKEINSIIPDVMNKNVIAILTNC